MKKRVLLQLSGTLLLALLLSTAFYFIICTGLRHSKRDAIGKYNFITSDKTPYDAVFFGASTLRLGINPIQFDSLTGSNSFNAAMDGILMPEINLMVRKYIKSHGAPKNIFILLNGKTLIEPTAVWYYPQYFPFVRDTDLNQLVNIQHDLIWGRYFPAWAVTYFDDPLKNLGLIGLKDSRKKDYNIPNKGYEEISVITGEDLPQEEATFINSEKGRALLENTLDLCKANNVKVSFILPPMYNSTLSDSSLHLLEKLNSYREKYDTRVFNFVGDKNFDSKDLFVDRIHVNSTGAKIFTQILAQEFLKTDSSTISKPGLP